LPDADGVGFSRSISMQSLLSLISTVIAMLCTPSILCNEPWNTKKAARHHYADKGGFRIPSIFPKGTDPIPLSLKHRKIKQFQYTLSPGKSTV
jgi:hypothetical protein